MFHVAIAGEHWLVVAAGASSSARRQPGPCDSVTESHTALAAAIVEPCTSECHHTLQVCFRRPWEPARWLIRALDQPGMETRAPGDGWADRGGDPSSAVCQGGTSTGLAQQAHMLCSVRDVVCVPSPCPSCALSLAPLAGFWPVAGLVSSWLSRGACTGALGQEASKPEAHVPSPPPPPRRPTRGPCQAGTASGHCPR